MPSLTAHPPKGLLRVLLRLPVLLYRLNLGWLLGQRFLMLTHTGRRSSKTYQTVVEVVDREKETGIYTIASGWGEKADWYRNVLKTPDVTVQVGRQQINARAVPLSVNEAQEKLFIYAQHHPGAFRELSNFMMGERFEANRENCLKMAQKIPLIALHPTDCMQTR